MAEGTKYTLYEINVTVRNGTENILIINVVCLFVLAVNNK